MVRKFKPLIVVIKKPRKRAPEERSLELPATPYPQVIDKNKIKAPIRGVTILNIHGDEKI
jgi:hypothetical protein